MACHDLHEDLEPHILNRSDVHQVFNYVVRWLRSENTTRYFEDHPAACDTIVTAVQELTRPKPLQTPAATPCNIDTASEPALIYPPSRYTTQEEDNQASIQLLSQHVVQEEELSLDFSTGLHENLPQETHDHNSRDTPQQLENVSHQSKHISLKSTDGSVVEGVTDDSHYLTSLHASPLGDHGNFSDQDIRLSGQHHSDTSTHSRKRKNYFDGNRGSKRTYFKAADQTEVDQGIRRRQYSGPFELHLGRDQDERHNHPFDISNASQDGQLTSVALPAATETPLVRSRRLSTESRGLFDQRQGRNDKFAKLSQALRAKLQMIRDPATLADVKEYISYTAGPPPSADDCDDIPKADPGLTASDQRLRVLKNCIVRDEKAEKIVKYLELTIRISKRAALAELIGRYIEERDARTATPKKIRKRQLPRLSPKDRFTDLLFPETKKTQEDGREDDARKKAKAKLSYWITLGEPLARMTQQFGYGILLLLPAKLTDKDLHYLPRPQIQDFLDYIDLVRPSLKVHANNLSAVLPLLPQRLVLETLTSNIKSELRKRCSEELSPFVRNDFDSHQAGAADGASCGQGSAGKQFCSTMPPVQSPSLDCISENPQPTQQHFAYTRGEFLSSQENCFQDVSSSAQQLSGHDRGGFPDFQICHVPDVDQSTQQQPGHSRSGLPEHEDYYVQEVDWRAQQPSSSCEVEFPDSSEGLLQRSCLSEAESANWESMINYSP